MKKILSLLLTVCIMLSSAILLSSCSGVQQTSTPDSTQSTGNDNEPQGQRELCEKIEKSLSANEIDKAVSLSSQLVKPLTIEEESVIMNALKSKNIQSIRKKLNTSCWRNPL